MCAGAPGGAPVGGGPYWRRGRGRRRLRLVSLSALRHRDSSGCNGTCVTGDSRYRFAQVRGRTDPAAPAAPDPGGRVRGGRGGPRQGA
ncbi:hypothetical protein GCM10010507_40110 [Streptomyces cinnamoneus]|uniref:Uncharacterized protein n=1 Tax=Streptomyces cinnamoneus TaxID=53446 RepID=A0A918TQT4_STRCJ|nr:hypothetical protein GCM10010507_40110 [Streptomyces cinnamoneus]